MAYLAAGLERRTDSSVVPHPGRQQQAERSSATSAMIELPPFAGHLVHAAWLAWVSCSPSRWVNGSRGWSAACDIDPREQTEAAEFVGEG